MSQRKVAWGLALLAGVAFLLTRTFSSDEPTTAPAPPAAPAAAPAGPSAGEPIAASDEDRAGRIHRSVGARKALPRAAPPEVPEADDAAGGEAAEEEDTGALPEGGRGSVVGVFTPDAMIDAMAEVSPDITDCVEEWQSVMDAELEGRLVLEMTLGPEGVIDAALVDVDGVPEPMLGCFGGIIYEAQWPLPEEVTDVAWPFQVVLEAEE